PRRHSLKGGPPALYRVLVLAYLFSLIPFLHAQPPLTFEAATIKRTANPRAFGPMQGGPGTRDPGQITWLSTSLRRIIQIAYERQPSFGITVPDWMNQEKYDIIAKVSKGATAGELHEMLRNLLVERLDLKVHHETQSLPSYDLVLLPGGPKPKVAPFKATPTPDSTPPHMVQGPDGLFDMPDDAVGVWPVPVGSGRVRLAVRGQSMAGIAQGFENRLAAPVADKTGLARTYSFNLDFWDKT